ncbi:MAG: NTPase [Candidatus Verstraetearchaeota archaeon]|nr:NTPase [Candidatus Verstraetearchaeota archaeon]
MKRVFLLTGPPGVGKTTVLLRAVGLIRQQKLSVGGMVTKEVRSRVTGARVGFELEDLATGRRGWLARAQAGPGPKIGRYLVDIRALEGVGASAVLDAAARSEVIAVDEIGPMELLSGAFRSAVVAAVESGKPLIATVHFRSTDPLVVSLKERCDAELFAVSVDNRGSMPGIISDRISELLGRIG